MVVEAVCVPAGSNLSEMKMPYLQANVGLPCFHFNFMHEQTGIDMHFGKKSYHQDKDKKVSYQIQGLS